MGAQIRTELLDVQATQEQKAQARRAVELHCDDAALICQILGL